MSSTFIPPTVVKSGSLWRVLACQTQVTFTDNASKLMLIGLAAMALPPGHGDLMISLLAGLLPVSFLLFSPVSGWLADRFSKRDVIAWTLWAQLGIILILILALYFESIYLAALSFFLLATQACFLSPPKQGILKELVPEERLGWAVGLLEMLTILAILGGALAGGQMLDYFTHIATSPWHGGLYTALVLFLTCVLSILVYRGTESTPAMSKEPFERHLLWQHFVDMAYLMKRKDLWLPALGVSFFYSFGGFFYLLLFTVGEEAFPDHKGAAGLAGILFLFLGIGIALGSTVCSKLCTHGIEKGLIPIGGIGMALGLCAAAFLSYDTWTYKAVLIAIGFFGAFFYVPLMALVQERAHDDERGRILGATNLFVNLGGLIAVGFHYFLNTSLSMHSATQMLFSAVICGAVAFYVVWLLPESLMRLGIRLTRR